MTASRFRTGLLSASLAVATAGTCIAPGLAASAVSGNVNITSSVSANCTLQTTPLEFGTYDPFSDAPLVGHTAITVRCTKGTANTIAIGNGLNDARVTVSGAQHAMSTTGDPHLDYRFCRDSTCASPMSGGITTPGTAGAVVETIYGNYAAAAASGLPLHIVFPSYWPSGLWASSSTVASTNGGTLSNEAEVTQLYGEVFAHQNVAIGAYADAVLISLTF